MVLTADKGVAMVIMTRQDYISKANHLLNQNTYRSIAKDPTNSIKGKLINILKRVGSWTGLDSNTCGSMCPTGCVPPRFCGLPKIHKPDTPLRPMVSGCGSVTYGVARELAKILGPLVGKSPCHIDSTQDFVEQVGRSNWSLESVLVPVVCLPCSPHSQWILPSASLGIYWINTTPSRKELLWRLGTLSSYWSFVLGMPAFLSKASSVGRLGVLPWVPQSAPLWLISTWSAWGRGL